jgi:hypothetical protein
MSSLLSFGGLCMDTQDPAPFGAFWSQALGLTLRRLPDGDVRLVGEEPFRTVWVNRVPEPKTVKNRVHLDVHGDVDSFLALGATVVDDRTNDWAVLADPEGGEFCVFPGDDAARPRVVDLVVDCQDSAALADWWGGAFDVEPSTGAVDNSVLRGVPGCPFAAIGFVEVPEQKTVKNRLHIDVRSASVEALLDYGATLLRAPDDEISWSVLADPEGNEFCVFLS